MGKMKDTAWDGFYEPSTAARRADPDTSKEAAEAMAGAVKGHAKVVLLSIQDSGEEGRTSEEIAGHTILDRYQAARRMRRLEEVGLIRKDGRTRLTSKDREANVYVAVTQ